MTENNTIDESVFALLVQKKEIEYGQAIAYQWAMSILEDYEINYGK